MICAACNTAILDENCLLCTYNGCNKVYHQLCAGSGQLINEFWICPECRCTTKKGGDNSSTPVGSAKRPRDPNVTHRIKRPASSIEMKQYDSEPNKSETAMYHLTKEMTLMRQMLDRHTQITQSCEAKVELCTSRIDYLNNKVLEFETAHSTMAAELKRYTALVEKLIAKISESLILPVINGEIQNMPLPSSNSEKSSNLGRDIGKPLQSAQSTAQTYSSAVNPKRSRQNDRVTRIAPKLTAKAAATTLALTPTPAPAPALAPASASVSTPTSSPALASTPALESAPRSAPPSAQESALPSVPASAPATAPVPTSTPALVPAPVSTSRPTSRPVTSPALASATQPAPMCNKSDQNVQQTTVLNPSDDQETPWIEQKRKHRRPTSIRGTAGPNVTTLKAVEPRKHLHLWNMASEADEIRQYLRQLCPKGTCTVEELKAKGEYKSYKVGVPLACYDMCLAENVWPTNARIKPWVVRGTNAQRRDLSNKQPFRKSNEYAQ